MSKRNIDTLIDLWAATLLKHGDTPPFANHTDLFNTIDATPLGDVPWETFSLNYSGEVPDDAPSWMSSSYDVWFRDPQLVIQNMVNNPDYGNQFYPAPTRIFDDKGHRQYHDFMTGDWVWEEGVSSKFLAMLFISYLTTNVQDRIASDPETHGAMLVPIILGSDKTTVSVRTGNNEYYPLYISIGTVHNNFC